MEYSISQQQHIDLNEACGPYEKFSFVRDGECVHDSETIITKDLDAIMNTLYGMNYNDFIATLIKPRTAMLYSCVSDTYLEKDYKDIDYTIVPSPNLFPKRTLVQGELRLVEWFKDSELTIPVLKSVITYVRDAYGFATTRETHRIWFDQYGDEIATHKVTSKNYTINMIEQIQEGKRRRSNIVDGIQLPTLSFMVETLALAPWSMSSGQALLMGRDFMDRHESYFSKFIDNSSSITDFNDANFGKKTVVVALEVAATTTDLWLKNTPTALGGATIEQYLLSEFTI